jgi:hypothetical protein
MLMCLVAGPALADPVSEDASLRSTIGWGNTVVPEHVSLSTEAGYDGAQQRTQATALVEATLITRLSIFATVTYGEETTGVTRPAVGAAYQIFDPRSTAVGVRVSTAYKPEGFSEPEGEFETILVLSHMLRRDVARMFVAYGRDADGHESDAEVGAGYLHRATENFVFGATTRYRYAIALKDALIGPRWDFIGGMVVDLAIDRWRFELLLGGGAVEINAATATGLLGLVSLGIDL